MKKHFKWWLTTLSVLALTTALAACDSKTPDAPRESENESHAATKAESTVGSNETNAATRADDTVGGAETDATPGNDGIVGDSETNSGNHGNGNGNPDNGYETTGGNNNDNETVDLSKPTEGLEYELNPDGQSYTLVGRGEVTDLQIVIPATYNNLPVTGIENAFSWAQRVTAVVIPDSVTYIGQYAFYYCSSLTSINIPDTVTAIGPSAFRACFSLTSLDIPESVTSIGQTAFMNCEKLESVSLPSGLTYIDYGTFSGCTSLTTVNIPDSVTAIEQNAFENCTSLFQTENGVQYVGQWVVGSDGTSVIIRNGAKGILPYALSNRELAELSIPESVTFIGEKAFEECKVKQATVPAFVCPLIKSNALEAVVITCGTKIEDSSFDECENLTSVTIPEGITSIGDNAFSGCANLTQIRLPNSVTHIGDSAFWGINEAAYTVYNNGRYIGSTERPYMFLASMIDIEASEFTIPSGTMVIGEHAFENSLITEIVVPQGVISIQKFAFMRSQLQAISLPDGLTEIDSYAFTRCNNLNSCVIPDSVTRVGTDAFYTDRGNGVKEIIGDLQYVGQWLVGCRTYIKTADIRPGTIGIAQNAFANSIDHHNSTDLTTVILPDGLKYICDGALSAGRAVNSISIPDSVIYIGSDAFAGCGTISEITVPGGVTVIRNSAFNGCKNLENAIISTGVTEIGDRAFYECYKLKTVTIPGTVTNIGASAFAGCSKIESITFGGTMAEWNAITKPAYWISNISYTVHCTDGNIDVVAQED